MENTKGSETEADNSGSGANEEQQLLDLAKINQRQAEQAALEAVPGTVDGGENGYMVWEIGVATNDGSFQEVKVDPETAGSWPGT